ncbi:MAG: alpha/beta hydrolase-fold protein, partial [Candidatus Fermentibacteraceae bacterium]
DRVRATEPFSSLVDSLSEVAATEAALRGELIVFRTTGPFECLVNTPEGYDGTETLPLLLGLHGVGGTPEGFMRLWNVAREFHCIMAVPQAPYPFDTGEGMGYSWFEDGYPMASSRDYVMAVLDLLEERYNIGEVYLFGYSQGAGMALMTGLHAPGRFNGIAPFSGWLPEEVTDQEIQAAAGLPVRIVHGEQDGAVAFDNAIQTVSVLAAHDYDVRLLPFQGEHRFETGLFRQVLEEFLGSDE